MSLHDTESKKISSFNKKDDKTKKDKPSLYKIGKHVLLKSRLNPDHDLLRYYYKKLSPKEKATITSNVSLEYIKKHKDITWSLSVIKRRDDLRMIDLKDLEYIGDFSSCIYRLTIKEFSFFCNDSLILEDYPFHKEALKRVNPVKMCEECLLKFMRKYPNINFPEWKLKQITKNFKLEKILDNLDISYWHKKTFTKMICRSNDNYEYKLNTKHIMRVLYKNPYILELNEIIHRFSYKDILKFHYLDWNINTKVIDTSKLPEIRQLRYFYDNNIEYCENIVLEYKNIDSLFLLTDKLSLDNIKKKLEFGSRGRLVQLNRYELPIVEFQKDMKEETKLSSWKTIDTYPFYNWDTKIIEEKSLDSKNQIPINLIKYFNKRIKFNYSKLSSFCDFSSILNTPYLDWDYDIISERKEIPFEFFKMFLSNNISIDNIIVDYEVEKEIIQISNHLKEFILVSDLIIDIIEYL